MRIFGFNKMTAAEFNKMLEQAPAHQAIKKQVEVLEKEKKQLENENQSLSQNNLQLQKHIQDLEEINDRQQLELKNLLAQVASTPVNSATAEQVKDLQQQNTTLASENNQLRLANLQLSNLIAIFRDIMQRRFILDKMKQSIDSMNNELTKNASYFLEYVDFADEDNLKNIKNNMERLNELNTNWNKVILGQREYKETEYKPVQTQLSSLATIFQRLQNNLKQHKPINYKGEARKNLEILQRNLSLS